jgi:hypothetical protein
MKPKLALFLAPILLAALITGAARSTVSDAPVADEGVVSARIDYHFAGDRGEVDSEGRRLVFEATVQGDIAGTMTWWFVDPAPAPRIDYEGGYTDYYEARWEIRADESLLLAGESVGKTFVLDGEEGIWDGHGTVTEGYGAFEDLVGRHYYETGPVVEGSDPPATMFGTAVIVIH